MKRLQAEFWKLWFCVRQGHPYHFVGLEPANAPEKRRRASYVRTTCLDESYLWLRKLHM